MIEDGLTALVGLCTVLITVWFAARVHKLEDRVDVLETQQFDDRAYIAKLRDFIYRHNLVPPQRD